MTEREQLKETTRKLLQHLVEGCRLIKEYKAIPTPPNFGRVQESIVRELLQEDPCNCTAKEAILYAMWLWALLFRDDEIAEILVKFTRRLVMAKDAFNG